VLLAGALALMATSLCLSGCSRESEAERPTTDAAGTAGQLLGPRPTDPGMEFAGARTLYPLAVGNRWDYRIRWRRTLLTNAGPQPPSTGEGSLSVEITGTYPLGDRDYFVQKVTPRDPIAPTSVVRKDRSGLYTTYLGGGYLTDADMLGGGLARELRAYVDRTVPDAAQRAAFQRAVAAEVAKLGGARRSAGSPPSHAQRADPGEYTLLRFPLFVGARWTELEGAEYAVARTVVGRERVQVPLGVFPAWKIRQTSEYLGPSYRRYIWYGSVGELRERSHDEFEATDLSGNVVGRVLIDGELSLTGAHLVRAGALAAGGE
jgi:hypothetical protein